MEEVLSVIQSVLNSAFEHNKHQCRDKTMYSTPQAFFRVLRRARETLMQSRELLNNFPNVSEEVSCFSEREKVLE